MIANKATTLLNIIQTRSDPIHGHCPRYESMAVAIITQREAKTSNAILHDSNRKVPVARSSTDNVTITLSGN